VRCPPLRRRRATSLLAVAAVVLAACGGVEPGDETDSAVSLDVPEDWTRSDPEVSAEVLESLRWAPARDDGSSLQVVVGCGANTTADDLLQGAARGERPVVGTAEEPVEVDVEGLDDARQVTFALGRAEQDVRAWMAGLYGTVDGVLVLVEYTRPHARFSPSEADELLGSIRVDASHAAEQCEAPDE
jgi:hypothetical protein